jgi:adenine-specific DNA-methyltransferase
MIDLRLGDCLEVMPTIPSGSVDCVIADAPYGTEAERDGYGRRANKRYIEGDKDLSVLRAALPEVVRVLKPNTWAALFCSPKRRFEVEGLCRGAGLAVVNEVVWDKKSPGLGGGIRYQHETVLLCGKGEPQGNASLFSVITELTPRAHHHPHEKPLRLMTALVRYCSRPDDLILDPFVGSGTTLVACAKTGRNGIGIEVDPQYTPIIERRLRAAETPLFPAIKDTTPCAVSLF